MIDATEKSGAAARIRMLEGIRGYSRPRTAKCGRVRCAPLVQVQRTPDNRITLQGCIACGSVWGCPRCACRIYTARALELQTIVEAWRGAGGVTSLLTLTVRHALGDSLERLREGLALAWRYFWQGRQAQARRDALGLVHHVRALEVTHGPNGWHPHLHVVLFTRGALEPEAEREIAESWQSAVSRALGSAYAPDLAHGADVRALHDDRYLAKMGLEVASIATKLGRGDNRTPWQIAQAAAAGDARSGELWRYYCESMLGARQLTWSVGARRGLRLEVKEDAELVEEKGVGTCLAEWDGEAWDRERNADREWLARVIGAAVSSDPVSALGRLPGVNPTGPPGSIGLLLRPTLPPLRPLAVVRRGTPARYGTWPLTARADRAQLAHARREQILARAFARGAPDE